jgi:uncharacterized protein YlzI (FlbEa/FlbD family)
MSFVFFNTVAAVNRHKSEGEVAIATEHVASVWPYLIEQEETSVITLVNGQRFRVRQSVRAVVNRLNEGEVVDASIVRVMGGAIEALTRVLEEANLGGRRTGQGTVDH